MKALGLALVVATATAVAQPQTTPGALEFESPPGARFHFTGILGQRIDANVENWLLRAPQANPGMLEMFRVRDRKPVPQLVPWAGEFVGKYLVSAISSLALTEDPRLSQQISNVAAAFIATQADDGYLGPFPKQDRLMKNWDLWGHYHALCALVLWHQRTGDPAALAAARKAADLVCTTYLDTGRRVMEAGDPEMNMAILTGLLMVHRTTGEPRYLRMVREVERDWEHAGDYLRAGLDGREFFESPRPRWESLHDLQGLLELWRATGENSYREAFVHHWRSIRRWDRRNTGGFSSGEQATGNPYAPSAIETCCTVAWLALTLDYLRLTGDSKAADDLELGTCNAGLGAQHPSGRWWTYNTPMDGVREASGHTIVFQARAGTPELNCCSVNGPRILGMLGEWAIMSVPDGLVLNSYFPGSVSAKLGTGTVELALDRNYPEADSQRVKVIHTGGTEWSLRARIPAWSEHTRIKANFDGVPATAPAGSYLVLHRQWKAGDEIELQFDFGLRAVSGANEAAGKMSIYRGPLLLAWDQALNAFDEDAIPALNLTRLGEATAVADSQSWSPLRPKPWIEIELPVDGENRIRLIDFASAGASGTRYRTWLAATNYPPPPAFTRLPRDGERLASGPIYFRWRAPRHETKPSCRLEIAKDEAFSQLVLATNGAARNSAVVDFSAYRASLPRDFWWRVVTRNPFGDTIPDGPAARFTLSENASPQKVPVELRPGPDGELIAHSLRNDKPPKFGGTPKLHFTSRDSEGTTVNGIDQMLVYSLPAWPEDDFTASVRVRVNQFPTGRIGQIFSAWAAGMDDPLRLVVDHEQIFTRIEAGGSFGTPGMKFKPCEWHRVAAVKQGATLTFFCDGQKVGATAVPQFTTTAAKDCALGGNPHFSGNEFLAATFADFALWNRALSAEELLSLGRD